MAMTLGETQSFVCDTSSTLSHFRHQISPIKNLVFFFGFGDFLFAFVSVLGYSLDVNHHILIDGPLMNDHCRIENELLLQCVTVWLNVDCCIGVKVRLMNLHLLEGIGIKELHNAHLASTNGVAEETGNELLGIRGHLGLGGYLESCLEYLWACGQLLFTWPFTSIFSAPSI